MIRNEDDMMVVNKFFLLAVGVALLIVLGMYLLDIFNIRNYDTMTILYAVMAVVIATLLSSEIIDKFELRNPAYFVVPGIIAVAALFITGKFVPIALVIGCSLLAPGIALLIRGGFRKKES
ncbi:MAG: hypothetical protein QW112_00510 [Candidatus Micrarchaeia archaeon]